MTIELTMDRVWSGVDRLLDDYLELAPTDLPVIAYTPDSRQSAAWIIATLRERGFAPIALAMAAIEDDGIRARLEQALPTREALGDRRLAFLTVERDTMSHSSVIREVLARYRKESWISARLISASEEFFTLGMARSKTELSRLNARLLKSFMTAERIHIETQAGTDLDIELDNEQYRWLSNRGFYRPGGFIVMPPGEVASYPANVSGRLVADGAFNINVYTELDARLATRPVTIDIEDGLAVNYSCADAKLQDMLEVIFATPNARRVGELGFGTNSGVSKLIGMNCHINERSPGLHIGFGQHNQSIYIVDYLCDLHIDFICQGGIVEVDGERLDLANLEPLDEQHPELVMDEDIDGDCCGLWLDDVRRGQCIPRGAPPAVAGGANGRS
ncbi:aminopeptidase [Kribbella sp. NBC_01505]|uniref:hypothetical protein n=1 Tax=Kribbella sp. NBC_01505 TaxID=2903580 RepID=UPI003867D01B